MNDNKQGSKKKTSRDAIKKRLVEATIKRLSIAGIEGVHARDLAKDAGCAVGTIYNIVGDLDNLILLACSNTLKEFWAFAIDRYEKAHNSGKQGEELLVILSEAYIDFYQSNTKIWQANFEISYNEESDYFKVYNNGQKKLLDIVVNVLKEIAPHVEERELLAIGRALWASVHGISMLAIANTSNMLPKEKILSQCKRIIIPVLKDLEIKHCS